jgi:hypothetical protein
MGRIYRPIQLCNGKRCVDVVGLIDTGADETVISEVISKKLGCETIGEFEASTITLEPVKLKTTHIEILDRWAKVKAKMLVGVTDKFFDVDEGIDIIIGVDFLQKTESKIDFSR